MHKPFSLVVAGICILSACTSMPPAIPSGQVSKEVQLACEQEALVAQQQYVARIKTPTYTSSRSTTWTGGARTDNGKWVFDAELRTCLLRAQQQESAGQP